MVPFITFIPPFDFLVEFLNNTKDNFPGVTDLLLLKIFFIFFFCHLKTAKGVH